MQLVFGRDAEVAALALETLGFVFSPPFVSIGVADDQDRIVGGLIFNHYNGCNIEVTAFLPTMPRRGILRAALHYPFKQLNVLRLTARTRRSNKALLRQMIRMGFVYEGTMKRYYGPSRADDAILYRLDPQTAQKWM